MAGGIPPAGAEKGVRHRARPWRGQAAWGGCRAGKALLGAGGGSAVTVLRRGGAAGADGRVNVCAPRWCRGFLPPGRGEGEGLLARRPAGKGRAGARRDDDTGCGEAWFLLGGRALLAIQ